MKHSKYGKVASSTAKKDKMLPKVGSLVRVRSQQRGKALVNEGKVGVVTDLLEMDDGYCNYEVVVANDRGWYSDLDLEVISESR
jgi:hypothetical protein